MLIDFSPERWHEVQATYRRWWAGELERPVVAVELVGRDPGRPMPPAPLLSQETCTDLSVSPEALIDRIDWELGRRVYLGDAYPYFNMDCFGPGVGAAFVGAQLDNSSGRVWFHPPRETPIEEIHFSYDPENVWLRRVKSICAAGVARWQGAVLMGMADLGGVLDILSTFRPSERLLLDLYDHPEEVKRLTWEAHEAWFRFYEDINAVLQPLNPGYSDWSAIYSDRPSYILQCDFCYMIGPQMFAEFARPELEAACRRLPRSFYHLDGPGQLAHLDSLLAIEALDGVQWVPGDGNPDCGHWPEVYRKIHAAGKKLQAFGEPAVLDAVTAQVGSTRGIHFKTGGPVEAEAEFRDWLKRYL